MSRPGFRRLLSIAVALPIAYVVFAMSSDGLDWLVAGILATGAFVAFVAWFFTKSPALRQKAGQLGQAVADFLSGLG